MIEELEVERCVPMNYIGRGTIPPPIGVDLVFVTGGVVMTQNIKLHASIAIKNPAIRKMSAAYERLFSALHLIDTLPIELLEVLEEEINDEYKDRRGPLADFMKCYRNYLKTEIAEAKARERMLRYGGR